MINILKKKIQNLTREFVHFVHRDQLIIHDENEFLAMSCGAFGPRFLAKVKRCKAGRQPGFFTRQV